MEIDSMTQAELILYLETAADLIESKATTVQEAAQILRDMAGKLR